MLLKKIMVSAEMMKIVMTVSGDSEVRIIALAGRTKDRITLIMA